MQSFFPQSVFATSNHKRSRGWILGDYTGPGRVLPAQSGIPITWAGPEGQWVKDVKCITTIGDHRLFAGFTDGNILAMDYTTIQGEMLPALGDSNKNNRILDLRPYETG